MLMELRPRLGSGNAFFQTSRPISKVEISSESSSVFVSILGMEWSRVLVLKGPPHISITPSRYQIDDQSITFSMIFEKSDKRFGSSAAEVLRIAGNSKGSKLSSKKFSVPKNPSRPICLNCGSDVLKNWFKFDRILELPSTPFEEILGEWFCHGHGDMSVIPQQNDCYHDDFSVMFHVKDRDQGVVLCQECSQWLGTIDKRNMIRLWGCTVKWELDDGSNWFSMCESPLETFFEAVRKTIVEEGPMKPVLKLLIESQVSNVEKHWMVLLIINGDLKVLLPDDADGNESDKNVGIVHCLEDDVNGEKLDVGWFTLISGSTEGDDNVQKGVEYWKSHLNELPIRVKLYSESMKKVLFKEFKEISGVKIWLNQVDVVVVKVAAPMFEAALVHLRGINELIPVNHRISDDLYVSYLDV